jgi:hypothetical protein
MEKKKKKKKTSHDKFSSKKKILNILCYKGSFNIVNIVKHL